MNAACYPHPAAAALAPPPAAEAPLASAKRSDWARRFDRLRKFKALHGHLDVKETHRNLYYLLRKLRKSYRCYVEDLECADVDADNDDVSRKMRACQRRDTFVLDESIVDTLREVVGEKDLLDGGILGFEEGLARLRAHRARTGHCVLRESDGHIGAADEFAVMFEWLTGAKVTYLQMKVRSRGHPSLSFRRDLAGQVQN